MEPYCKIGLALLLALSGPAAAQGLDGRLGDDYGRGPTRLQSGLAAPGRAAPLAGRPSRDGKPATLQGADGQPAGAYRPGRASNAR